MNKHVDRYKFLNSLFNFPFLMIYLFGQDTLCVSLYTNRFVLAKHEKCKCFKLCEKYSRLFLLFGLDAVYAT